MDIVNLNSFLKFGYFLDYKYPDYSIDFSGTDKTKYQNVPLNNLIEIGIKKWFKTIEKQFNINEKHVVPLSGGIDSRAILATLMEFTETKNIYTYTFGTPGTLDFDIGNKIAKITGTNHTSIPLSEYQYTLNELIEISKRIDHQTLLFLHPNVALIDKLFSEYNVWSGAIIDVFFGRHTHINKASNLNDAIRNSFSENIFVKSTDLTCVDNDEFFNYIDFDFNTEGIHYYEHVIDLMNRQLKFIAPHVLMKGYNYKTLLDRELTDFALSVDKSLLENQYLYINMFLKAFPYLFSLPIKTFNGLTFNASNVSIFTNKLQRGLNVLRKKFNSNYLDPRINYIDYNAGIRDRKDLNKLVYENIMDLKHRKIVDWIDIDKIWNNHINKKANHADALIVLASLEIHLKAGKKI